MPRFTVEQMREIMDKKDNIRNATVIAHVDHGKTTLTDSLVRFAGISSKNRYTDSGKHEEGRGITISSTGLSLFFDMEADRLPRDADGTGFLLNLIDSPGHVDFSPEVSAALRVTDGALVVVDYVEGVCVQTGTVLRQALNERVKPVLIVNKLDRAFLELQHTPEDVYSNLQRVIEDVNVLISTHQDVDSMGDCQVRPDNSTVAFGSGLHGWGFTIGSVARELGKQLNKDPAKLAKKLWGEHYYDPETKKWTQSPFSASGKQLQRGFCQFVIGPIFRLIKACLADDKEKVYSMVSRLGITLSTEEKANEGKALMKCVMPKCFPMAPTLLEMAATHLPSPKVAQRYRAEILYTGPMDDECATAVRECDPKGPLMVYVSKMVPNSNASGRFLAFGRVFSGVARTGQQVRIMGPTYEPGSTKDLFVRGIQRTCISMGRYFENVDDVPCGNTICMVGIDQYLLKSGTLTTSEVAHTFRTMKFSVSPVVRVAVKPAKRTDIAKLAEALKKLVHIDPSVQCLHDEDTGEMIVAGVGELHLEIVLAELEELAGVEIIKSNPVVTYKETVTAPSSQRCLAKSPNKHNRLWMTAEPLVDGLTQAIEAGEVSPSSDPKARGRTLVEKFQWDLTDTKKIWAFGPDHNGPNLLVNCTRAAQYLGAIKDSYDAAFQWATREGAICGEATRGVRWNIVDVSLHADSAHRGPGQIIPAARAAIYGAQLCAEPRLMEPVFLVEVQTDEAGMSGVYNVLSRRRGHVFFQELGVGRMYVLKAYMPVAESFRFTDDLRAATGGNAFPQCVFDHWQILGNPFEEGAAQKVALEVRQRRGMKLELPTLADYVDKL